MNNINLPRPEYPRPDFERKEWFNLNGEWQFDFDDENSGEENGWYKGKNLSQKIIVPFCYQSELSGISDKNMHEIMWYKREFSVPQCFGLKKIFLNFGAVDYDAKVWVNGEFIDSHKGGYVPFKMDITRYLVSGSNSIVVKVVDKYECIQPRGKQYWKEKPDRCWYTATSGIWQTVWLETTGELNIDKIRITPDIDAKNALLEVFLNTTPKNAELDVNVSFKSQVKSQFKLKLGDRVSRVTIDLKEEDYIDELQYWTPETPNLYDLKLVVLEDGKTTDEISSYFGMRKISVEGNNIFLNNKPYYLKLILDQGYWSESLLTPPSDQALKYDVEMTKKFGFNGARKHQKIEDPRYYYWADKLGLLVWGEMPSPYDFNSEQTENVTKEWIGFINRDYNHPSIMAWVPLNESWGVRNIISDKMQQSFGESLYYIAKSMDKMRLVSTNDGWEQVKSDICGIHDYVASGEEFTETYKDMAKFLQKGISYRIPYAYGHKYEGQPFLISEYGGIAFSDDSNENWGYNGAVKDEESFLIRYESITAAIRKMHYICGYCYTQLTDVMQEINGLMTMDRKVKVNIEAVKKINQ